MMNNPFPMLINLARNGGNPTQMIRQMANSDPQIAQAYRMIEGKSPAELRQIATNMCRERGTTPEAVMQQLGLR